MNLCNLSYSASSEKINSFRFCRRLLASKNRKQLFAPHGNDHVVLDQGVVDLWPQCRIRLLAISSTSVDILCDCVIFPLFVLVRWSNTCPSVRWLKCPCCQCLMASSPSWSLHPYARIQMFDGNAPGLTMNEMAVLAWSERDQNTMCFHSKIRWCQPQINKPWLVTICYSNGTRPLNCLGIKSAV